MCSGEAKSTERLVSSTCLIFFLMSRWRSKQRKAGKQQKGQKEREKGEKVLPGFELILSNSLDPWIPAWGSGPPWRSHNNPRGQMMIKNEKKPKPKWQVQVFKAAINILESRQDPFCLSADPKLGRNPLVETLWEAECLVIKNLI